MFSACLVLIREVISQSVVGKSIPLRGREIPSELPVLYTERLLNMRMNQCMVCASLPLPQRRQPYCTRGYRAGTNQYLSLKSLGSGVLEITG